MKTATLILTALLLSTTISLTGAPPAGPDSGDQLVFTANAVNELGQQRRALFRIRVDGTGREQISRAGDVRQPSVSSVGRKLVYSLNPRIHVMDWDGTNDVDITPIPREHYQPKWSPDGQRIVLASDRTGNSEVYVIDPDGGKAANLTWNLLAQDQSPCWSPDGKRIAFTSNRRGRFEIFVMDADGMNLRAATDGQGDCREPDWSPDGKWIAFSVARDGQTHLALVHPDGTGFRQLTNGASWNGQPAWAPDSRRLGFVSDREGNADVFTLDVESGKPQNVTNTPDDDERYPAWVPRQTANTPLAITEAKITKTDLPRPRMLFRAEDLPAIRKRFEAEPYAAAWKKHLNQCDAWLDSTKPASLAVEKSIEEIALKLDRDAAWIQAVFNLGFAYQVTGQEAYGRRAAAWMARGEQALALNHGPCLGLWTVDPPRIACAYDWLYGIMTPEQRKPIETVMAAYLRKAIAGAMVGNLFLGPKVQEHKIACNITLIEAGCYGTVALALAGEPGYDPVWLSAAIRMTRQAAEWWLAEEGMCIEGATYFNWASEFAMPFLVSAHRHGMLPFLPNSRMSRFPRWLATSAANDFSVVVAMGDDNAGPPVFPAGYLEIFKDDPWLEFLWTRNPKAAAPPADVYSLLWWRPAKRTATPPAGLPRSAVYESPGLAVFRSGWDPNAPLLAVAASAAGGHGHADAGSIQLYGYGERLLTDLGYGTPFPEEANQVLVNGRGRGWPPVPLGKPLFHDFTRGALVDFVKVDATDTFRERLDGHPDHNHIDTAWYPMRKFIRYAALVSEKDSVPPYFVLYDDIDRNGKPNRYDSLFHTVRDSTFEIRDHEAIVSPLYRGPWFAKADETAKTDGAVEFSVPVKEPGDYRIWIFQRANQGGPRMDGKPLNGATGMEPLYWTRWQWKPLLGNDTNRSPVTVSLNVGEHQLTHAGTRFANILLTRETNAAPWQAEATEVQDAILLKAADGKVSGNRVLKRDESSRACARIAFLNPAPVDFKISTYTHRTVHYGKVPVSTPTLTATSRAVNPRFVTLIYPYREGMEQPVIERHVQDGFIWSKVAWKGATDWILSAADGRAGNADHLRTDAALAVVRHDPDGRTRGAMLDGKILTLDEKPLLP